MTSYQGNILIKNPATPTGPAQDGTAPGIWKLNEALAFVRQGIWPTQGVQGRDPYFPYVSLLLSTTALGNANNNLFVDSSGAFNPISRNGNTTQGSVTPYSASWSNFFDGTGDFLSNSGSNVMTGNFTIEMWGYFQGFVSSLYTIGTETTQRVGFYITSGGLLAWDLYGAGTTTFSGATVPLRTWVHIAFVKSGTSITAYLNGVSAGTQSMNYTVGNANGFYVGGNGGGMNGYLSNFRVVNGTAVYTSNFTPPTAPLTAITNTFLLTCQSNRFRDASTNNFTLTRNGDVTVTEFSPFAPASPGIVYNQSDITNWSGYFDGNGDYLNAGSNSAFALGTGDFTIECWFYQTAAAGNQILISTDITNGFFLGWDVGNFNFGIRGVAFILSYSPSNQNLNQWNHVVVSRSGSTNSMFWNGTRVATTSDTYNFSITGPLIIGGLPALSGYYWNGYISNVRVVKGTAVYNPSSTTITVPTSPLTAISGTSILTLQNAAFTDNSTNNFGITPFGNTTVTGNSPFQATGLWSLAGATNQGATIPQTTATDLGAGSFTIECWVNAQVFNTFVTKRRTDTALTGSWMLSADASGYFYFLGVGWASTYAATTNPIPLNKWTHLAVSRSGTNLSMFVDGVRVYNVTDSYDYTCSTYTIIKLGGNSGGNYPSGGALSFGFTGSISNLRIVQGTAVYNPASTTLIVPTSPLTAISGTSLLTCQNSTMKDNSANNNTSILLYNGGSIQSFDPFYTSTIASNGGSMYFDGNGDYLLANTNPTNPYSFGTGDFTIEAWVYANSISTYAGLIDARASVTVSNYAMGLWDNSGNKLDFIYGATRLTSASTFSTRQWVHFAVTRASGTIRLFINGVLDANTASYSSAIDSNRTQPFIGAVQDPYYLNGYMSDFRITKGAALYTASFTPPTAPVTPSANTTLLVNGMNAGAYDATAINNMETVGDARVSTAVSKFGGSSMAFDGTGDYLSMPSSPSLILGSSNFTAETWFYAPSTVSTTQHIMGSWDGSSTLSWTVGLGATNKMAFVISTTGAYNPAFEVVSTATFSTGTWNHLAFVRNGSAFNLYLNGVSVGSLSNSSALYSYPQGTKIGGNTNSQWFNGYLDDLRITNGVARYTANFTPPTTAFLPY